MSTTFNSPAHAIHFLRRHGQIEDVEGKTIYTKRNRHWPHGDPVAIPLQDAFDYLLNLNYCFDLRPVATKPVFKTLKARGMVSVDTERPLATQVINYFSSESDDYTSY